jgi:hypothetical protein
VQALRNVRDGFVRKTEVGFAFFDALHRDYYAFSPQVSTMMARQSSLSDLVLQAYVRPLIVSLKMLQSLSFDDPSDDALGMSFISHHPDRLQARATADLLDQVRTLVEGGGVQNLKFDGALVKLLRERAWSSTHVQWGLIEPIRIYAESLRSFLEGGEAAEIGATLRQSFDDWAAEMPLDQIWASLSRTELESELATLEAHILRSGPARTRFRNRLKETFGGITAIRGLPTGPVRLRGDG